jgi:peptidoglycan/xylan/chitin deacetylase (PgdA/CDA1 family)
LLAKGRAAWLTEDYRVNILLPFRGGLPFTAPDGLPILLYHKVGSYPAGAAIKAQYVSAALFRAHMAFLHRQGYHTVALADVLRYLRGETLGVKRPVVITFDDGYECVYHNALPVLRRLGFGATIFVVVGSVGGVNDWEAQRTLALEPMLTPQHIVEMAGAGIEIGSHCMAHQRLTRLPPAELRATLGDSKKWLEDLTGRQVSAVAYPFGDHNEAVRAAAAEAGYLLGCSTERGVNRVGTDPFALKRVNIRRYAFVPLFARKLRLAYLLSGPRARR